MSPDKQRIAIAEACGWKDCHESENWADTIGTLHEVNGNQYARLPDYLNDLNAMHEAEKRFGVFQLMDYFGALGDVCYRQRNDSRLATAAQRAEAFLRTIGKWEDDN